MHAVKMTEYGPADSQKIVETARPVPGPGGSL